MLELLVQNNIDRWNADKFTQITAVTVAKLFRNVPDNVSFKWMFEESRKGTNIATEVSDVVVYLRKQRQKTSKTYHFSVSRKISISIFFQYFFFTKNHSEKIYDQTDIQTCFQRNCHKQLNSFKGYSLTSDVCLSNSQNQMQEFITISSDFKTFYSFVRQRKIPETLQKPANFSWKLWELDQEIEDA